MLWLRGLAWAVAAAVPVVGGLIFLVGQLASRMYHSVKPLPPSAKQLQEETDFDSHALFHYLPSLRTRLAWRKLGQYPTPIHTCTMHPPSAADEEKTVSFKVKREDLASPLYGGNKVRTLQHQLGCIEVATALHPEMTIYAFGSGGSNQVVATVAHGFVNLGLRVRAMLMIPDEPELENTINMLSTFSMLPGNHCFPWGNICQTFSNLRRLAQAIYSPACAVMPPGGNNVLGVLGQLSGCLELARQIDAGETPDPQSIYLAVGSSCTTTGLVMGVALARRLNLKAFQHKDFTIKGCLVHHGMATMQRNFGLLQASIGKGIVMMPLHGIKHASRALVDLGGPDVRAEAQWVLHNQLELLCDKGVVGTYGAHSKKSLVTSQAYDRTGSVVDEDGQAAPHIWLCGHFVAKPVTHLLEEAAAHPEREILLWQTKSATLPRGEIDEFKAMQAASSQVRRWADQGQATSTLRPGAFDSTDGSSADYRDLMSPL